MSNHLDQDRRAYRMALCTLSHRDRLEIEFHLLSEMKQRVHQAQKAQMQFDKLGGQSRMDSIEMCLKEMRDRND